MPLRRGGVVCLAAKKAETKEVDGRGYITSDNSGKSNIFPTASKAYYSSPTSDAVAGSGLGGTQGVGVLAAALVVVAIATAGVVGQQGDALSSVDGLYSGDSLTAIASRLTASQ